MKLQTSQKIEIVSNIILSYFFAAVIALMLGAVWVEHRRFFLNLFICLGFIDLALTSYQLKLLYRFNLEINERIEEVDVTKFVAR